MKLITVIATALIAVAGITSFAEESVKPAKGALSSRATVIENAIAAAEK